MNKRTTIVDIATRLGITPSAVSKAFSDHPRISRETKSQVQKVAQELGYHRNLLATGLRKGKSGLIGVVVPGVHYSFFSTAIKGIEEYVTAGGYNVVIVQSRDSAALEKTQLEGLLRAQVEGIIASVAGGTREYSEYVAVSRHLPVVLFDRTFSHENISEVTIDDFRGARLAVNHLVDMNYRRIAHLAGFAHVRAFGRRIEAYRQTLASHGIPVREDYIRQCAPNSTEGERAMEALLQLEVAPDAVFAASDYLAYGAMKTLLKRGYRIPEDVGIVGFSNEEFTSQVTPDISTVEQYSETMGSVAAQVLIDQLQTVAKGLPCLSRQKVIEPRLIVRHSSRRESARINTQ